MSDSLDDYIQDHEFFGELLPNEETGEVTANCGACGKPLPTEIEDGRTATMAMPSRDGTPCCSSGCRTSVNALL